MKKFTLSFLFVLIAGFAFGQIWSKTELTNTANLKQIHALDASNALIAGSGVVHKTTNGGYSWSEIAMPANVTKSVIEMFFHDASIGYITYNDTLFVRTADAGATWTVIDYKAFSDNSGDVVTDPAVGVSHKIMTGVALDATNALVVMRWQDAAGKYYGKVFKTTDAGLNWAAFSADLYATYTGYMNAIQFDAAGQNGFMVGNKVLYSTTDGGATWTQKDDDALGYIADLYVESASTVYLATANGVVKTTDAFANYNLVVTGYSYDVQKLSNGGLIAGKSGSITNVSFDDGATWKIAGMGIESNYWKLGEFNGKAYALCNGGILYTAPVDNLPKDHYTINHIQYTADAGGNSPLKDSVVVTYGIVTASVTGKFYIQDGDDQWDGVYVYQSGQDAVVGDSVRIKAKVAEYYNVTELTNIEEYTVISSGNALPKPAVLKVEDVVEPYEGGLITLVGTCTAINGSVYTLSDASGDIPVRSTFYNANLEIGKIYKLTGVVEFDFGAFKLLPVSADAVAEVVPDLFFSEYAEGSSNHKYLEIYNPTDAEIDLSTYAFPSASNGADGNYEFWNKFADGAKIPAGGIYIISHPDADPSIVAKANMTHMYLSNGDDGYALAKIVGTGDDADTLYIDWIGDYGIDPGSGWDVAGVSSGTANHTLIRKPTTLSGNTWANSAGTNASNSEWVVMPQNYWDDLGFFGVAGNDFLSFEFVGLQVGESVIDAENGTIAIDVINGADATSLVATFTVSPGATVKVGDVAQVSGTTANDFSSPVTYVVTGDNGESMNYVVTVTKVQSPYNDIISFVLQDQVEDAVIDATAHTVNAIVKLGTDITSIVPFMEVSAGATVSPDPTVATDFTNAVVYTVTSESAVSQEWTVTVVVEDLPEPTIYQIQYTEDESGDSPYKGQKIVTSGIVTALGSNFFYMQDGAGAWNGVYVYDGSNGNMDDLAVGDDVTIVCEVAEYYGLTELLDIETLTINSSGNDLPAATVVTTGDAYSEDYEGVLITIENAEVTADASADPNDKGRWTINDGSGDMFVDDVFVTLGDLIEVGKNYNFTGPSYYTYDKFCILPRSAEDISLVSSVENPFAQGFKVYPNPNRGMLYVDGIDEAYNVAVYNAIGSQVYQSSKTFTGNSNINLDFLNNGVYFVRIQTESNQVKTIKLVVNK